MKTNATKKAIFKKLEELNDKYPQQRVGQMLYNFILCKCPNNDPFYVEDEMLLNYILEEIDNAKETQKIIDEIMKDRKALKHKKLM